MEREFAMSRHAVLGMVTAVMLLLPGTASAKTVLFDGTAKGDAETTIRFTATDAKQRGDFTADRVSEVLVYNQAFTCYDAAGNAVGRAAETRIRTPRSSRPRSRRTVG